MKKKGSTARQVSIINTKASVAVLAALMVSFVIGASLPFVANAHAPALSITQIDGQTTASTVTISAESLPVTVDVSIQINHTTNAHEIKDLGLFVNGVQHGDLEDVTNSECPNSSSCVFTMPWTISSSDEYELYVTAYHGNKNDTNNHTVSATVTVIVDIDADDDGVNDENDNCVNTFNADQLDSDDDGEGDVCDETPYIQYMLEVDIGGQGSVTSSPEGINCEEDCDNVYNSGTVVTLTPNAAVGYEFDHWLGDCTGDGACQVTMNDDKVVTAVFVLIPPTEEEECLLDEGTWNSETQECEFPPEPIFGCMDSNAINYNPNATQDDGGCCYEFELAIAVTGGGEVTSSPSGIDCPSDCEQSYEEDTVVTLTATPDEASTFDGWGGACSGTGECVVTMDEAKSVTASFLTIPVENTEALCTDGSDNDGDEAVDLADSDCEAFVPSPVENTEALCTDGIDNDGDEATDLADSDCAQFVPVTPPPTPPATPPAPPSGGGGGGGNGPIVGSLGGGGGNGPIAGSVLGASTTTLPELPAGCSALLTTYMRMGKKNDVEEVKKLQQFLNDYMQANLPITGFFGSETDKWVRAFQTQHEIQVLTPWGINYSTGYVYKTTQRWINLTQCSSLVIPMPELN